MKTKKIIPENDYLCKCGTLLHNALPSQIKRHKTTNKHFNLLFGKKTLFEPTKPIKIEHKKITLTFD